MDLDDVGLWLDLDALKRAFVEARDGSAIREFFELPIGVFCAETPGGLLLNKLALPLSGIGLSERTLNCLHNAGYQYVWEVAGKTDTELLRIENFGRKEALPNFRAVMEQLGVGEI